MKTFALLSLISFVLAYPRKALPKSVPLNDDFEELDTQDLSFGYDRNDGMRAKGLTKSFSVDDENGKLAWPERGTIIESEPFGPRSAIPKTSPLSNEFVGNELADSNPYIADDLAPYEDSVLQVTVPLDYSHGLKFGAFPRQAIAYQMGTKVLTDDVAIYIIYYGNWQSNQKDLLNEFTSSLGDSCTFYSSINISLVEYNAKVLLSER